jgi:hypothetical protein
MIEDLYCPVVDLLRREPCLVPVGSSASKAALIWQDVGTCPFPEAFWSWSLDVWEK